MPTHLQRQQRALTLLFPSLVRALKLWQLRAPPRLQFASLGLIALREAHLYWPFSLNCCYSANPHKTFLQTTVPEKISSYNTEGDPEHNYPEGSSLESYTVSIVQLLGLHVGLSFDNPDICYCSVDVCTMSPEAVHSLGVKEFSVCSLDEFKYIASNYDLECLHNTFSVTPVYKHKPVTKKVCGNGVLEQGEQCDCGTAKNCTHKACCDTTMCKLKRDKICGSGECCTQSCKLKPAGVLCRKSHDECDFTEFCDGKQPHCVPDTYKYDGTSCNSGDSFCYEGKCKSTDKQCQKLIGGDSKGAPFACFDEINASGDRFGNCGSKPCLLVNVMCGKLVCTWPYKTLVSRANLSVIYTHIRDDMCVSTFPNTDKAPTASVTTYLGPEDRDKTFVEDGTACGPEMLKNLMGKERRSSGAVIIGGYRDSMIVGKCGWRVASLPVRSFIVPAGKAGTERYSKASGRRSVSEENSSYSKLSLSESWLLDVLVLGFLGGNLLQANVKHCLQQALSNLFGETSDREFVAASRRYGNFPGEQSLSTI
ncbi:disintegrin and metalloproteinase domain-containing protein 5-like [Saccopteryx bilineata]|uniref:disintegrin and metalloproteinase domain-containing protein 5-like n=1 Tax=Saccopteryx bilineata TaxID=59482 RepID=UPI00338E16EC